MFLQKGLLFGGRDGREMSAELFAHVFGGRPRTIGFIKRIDMSVPCHRFGRRRQGGDIGR